MLKNRFSRLLLLLLMGGATLGALYIMELFGFGHMLFPSLMKNPDFHLWMPVLPSIVVCVAGQFIGDILNIKAINDSGFITFIKQILFIAMTVLMMLWCVYSMMDADIHKMTELEYAFLSLGLAGPLFVFVIYVLAYLFWWKKKVYPFFFIFACVLCMFIDYFLMIYWMDGSLYVLLGLVVLCVVLWFTKPDERIFDEYDDTPIDPKKVAEELAYLNDPHYRPGLDNDYDSNGYYVGAKCKNCAYYKTFYDEHGLCQSYCLLGNSDCHAYGYCSSYKRNYE